MTEILEKFLTIFPGYLQDLLRLSQQPKTFIRRRIGEDALSLQSAVTFLAVSFVFSWTLKISFERHALWVAFATDGTFVLFESVLYGVALCLAWRAVRGRAKLESLFAIHFYYCGVALLMRACTFMTAMGLLRAADGALYRNLLDVVYRGELFPFLLANAPALAASPAFLAAGFISVSGSLAALGWLLAGWGAYRELNRLARTRSALAGALYLLLSLPVEALLVLIANSAVGGSPAGI